jgi:membrane protein YqaA with SNARE-associated domain
MFIGHAIAALLPTTVGRLRLWLFQLGGLGLIPLGVLDNSLVPLPGTMDAATIVLSARQEQLWLYYAFMATAGTVIGGFVTYRIAHKGGRQVLKRTFSSVKMDKVCEIFGRWGFGSIAISALLSPPVPIVPFLFVSGATQYPIKEFLFALTLGRISRYMILAYFSARYGKKIIAFIAQHGHPVLLTVIVVVLAATAVSFYFWGKARASVRREN